MPRGPKGEKRPPTSSATPLKSCALRRAKKPQNCRTIARTPAAKALGKKAARRESGALRSQRRQLRSVGVGPKGP
jgi:hypothetical protein